MELKNKKKLPPAAKTLFIKRVLDSQKFFIGRVWILFFYLCTLWLKLGGGFWVRENLAKYMVNIYNV